MQIDPLLPLPLIGALAAVGVVFVVARVRRGTSVAAIFRGLAMVVLATVIAIDPAITGGTSEARRAAADVLFVVDSTSSMAALDFNGDAPRLDGVRADIVELAAEFPGAHFSLIRFDSQARLELPWTTDLGALETAVSVLRQERALYSRGSRLDLPLQLIDEQLPRPGAASGADGGYNVVFYFSDGEVRRDTAVEAPLVDPRTGIVLPDDESEQAISSFAELVPDVDGGAVLGYGTTDGAPMLAFVGTDEMLTTGDAAEPVSPYVLDYDTEQLAISRIDEGNLEAIADDLGVPYLHRSEPGGLGAIGSALADAAPTVNDGSRATLHRLYWIPALLLFAVLLWQAAVTTSEALAMQRLLGGQARPLTPRTYLRWTAGYPGDPTRAGGMSGRPPTRRRRRQFLVLPVAIGLLAVGGKLGTMYAFAAAGSDAYDDERYEVSGDSFGRLETLNVIDPWRTHLGVGDARYRQGDLLAAEAAFSDALEVAPDRCDIRFNLAVTIEAQGDRLLARIALVAEDSEQATARRLEGPNDPGERYSVALGIAEAGECPTARADDEGDRLAQTQARLIAKLAALDADRANDEEALDPENATENERGDSEQIDDLELRNEAGASQREAARDRDTSGVVPDGQSNW